MSLGFPSALQMFFEVAFFTMAIWMSGILGKNSQAANQIALNLSAMTFMFAMGLGVVAMIRVGNQFGMKTYADLRRIAISLFLLIGLFDALFCIIYLSFNEQLPWIYLENYGAATPSDTLEVVSIAAGLFGVWFFSNYRWFTSGNFRGFKRNTRCQCSHYFNLYFLYGDWSSGISLPRT